MESENKSELTNVPVPLESESRGEPALSAPAERVPSGAESIVGTSDEPVRIDEFQTADPPVDDTLRGGYASVKGSYKSQNRLVWIVLTVMVVVCIATGVLSSVLTAHFLRGGETPPIITPTDSETRLAAVIEARKSNVVEVFCGSVRGTGVVTKVEGEKIFIITNQHVISNGSSTWVRFRGEDERVSCDIIGYDTYYDIAVLTVGGLYTPRYKLYDIDGSDCFKMTETCSEGEPVVAIGNAMSMGIASYIGNISRPYELLNNSDKVVPVFRTTSVINAGMSGCPVFDGDGNMIGLGTYRMSSTTAESTTHGTDVEDTGFATPISIVYPVYKQILAYGSGGDMGMSNLAVTVKNSTSSIGAINFWFDGFGGFTAEYRKEKLTVVSLDSANPPSNIKTGDVITSIAGIDITSDICGAIGATFCCRKISTGAEPMRITFDRAGAAITVAVKDYERVVW